MQIPFSPPSPKHEQILNAIIGLDEIAARGSHGVYTYDFVI